jgi:uncharacterized protein (DUF3084 family)
MNQGEGEPKDYKEYFYGKKEEELSIVDAKPELFIVPEKLEDIKLKLEELKSQIELAKENKDKYESLNKNSEYKIEEQALTSDIRDAGKTSDALVQQEKVLNAKLLELTPRKQSFRSRVASFLGLLP